jgi:hypothetical protein
LKKKRIKYFWKKEIYTFKDGGTCNKGELRAIAKEEGSFDISIYFRSCSGVNDIFYLVNNSTQTVIINGISYSNVSVFRGYTGILYYSKTHGMLKIEDYNQTTLFHIVS